MFEMRLFWDGNELEDFYDLRVIGKWGDLFYFIYGVVDKFIYRVWVGRGKEESYFLNVRYWVRFGRKLVFSKSCY